jgi:hypothetical protein
MILNVLRDLPFSRNQSLKSADGYYIRIWKNKIKNLNVLGEIKKTKNIRPCDLN